ncbi:uncharacterized protein LOC112137741 [Oryzias melastigma]|uniref:uncharacterized protein LOC112137741 n=1 Tax=Oryzias melastigma TaxID=30732 RepID=UPI00168D13A2|nr:uncharacterized protein LOC112137741 [Oryzias melastigma]
MTEKEELADYLARVEKIVVALNRAKETLSDALLVAMVLKGLTDEYAPFSVHVTQTRETLSFNEFKARLRSFECSLRYRSRPRADEVIMINHKGKQTKYKNNKKYFSGECFICERVGHKAKDCRNKAKKPQSNLRAAYTQNSSKAVAITDTRQSTTWSRDEHTAEQETFILRASEWQPHNAQPEGLLVDSGASAHIMTSEEAFIRFDETFRPKDHVMQLADGTRIAGSVLKKGDAQIKLTDSNGRVVSVQLTNALLIPGYPQDILSVEAEASKGAKFNFELNNNKRILPNGRTCDMKVKDRLYYLDMAKENCDDSCNACYDLKTWHEVMGHCNYDDVIKLETVVDGMKIKDRKCKPNTCETCLQGKFTQTRNREADVRAEAPLELIHTDLGGPIVPESLTGINMP